jgi:hypothetical protein
MGYAVPDENGQCRQDYVEKNADVCANFTAEEDRVG